MTYIVKNIFLSCCFIALSLDLLAQQQIYIFGQVQSTTEEPLVNALITSSTGYSIISNAKGYYQLSIPKQDSLFLEVQFVGYETIDTLVFVSDSDSLNINFQLAPTVFDLPEITVQAVQQNLYERSNWVIIDYSIWNDQVILIALEGRKRWLYQYTLNGKLRKRERLQNKYADLHLSCLGGLHLISDDHGMELKWINNEVELQAPYDKQRFEDLIQTCLFKWDNRVLFKNWSNHNQQIDYFYYDQQEAISLYRTIDPEAIKLAQSQVNKIIGLYYRAVGNPNSGGILNAKIEKTNIIAEGWWDGDLIDLITPEDNGVMSAIMYYDNTLSRPLRSWEVVHQEQLLIFDFVQQKANLFDRLSSSNYITLSTNSTDQIWKDDSDVFLQDAVSEKMYFLNSSFELFELLIKRKRIELKLIQQLEGKGNYQKKYYIHQNRIYFLANITAHNTQNKLFSLAF